MERPPAPRWLAVSLHASARAIGFNMFSAAPLAHGNFDGRVFTVGMTCAVLFAALLLLVSFTRATAKPSELL